MGKKNKKYWIGIDLGGTKLLTALLTRNFKVVSTLKIKVDISKGAKHFLETAEDSIFEVLKESEVSLKEVGGIGIGAPGIIDAKKGTVLYSPNIPFLKDFQLARELKKMTGKPVVLGNDVNVGLYGEHHFGAARGYSDVVGIFLGTGVGGALVLNGKIHEGFMGAAGEVGHMIMEPGGNLCGCGQRGCLESITGRLAIAAEASLLAARQQAKYLYKEVGTEVSKMKSGVLAKAIQSGDKALEKMIRGKAEKLGLAMANLVNVLNPELIVLGGGLVESLGNIILKEAENSMKKFAMPKLAANVKVAAAELGDHAIIKGAARMAFEKFAAGEK